jgi:hypothetical protein
MGIACSRSVRESRRAPEYLTGRMLGTCELYGLRDADFPNKRDFPRQARFYRSYGLWRTILEASDWLLGAWAIFRGGEMAHRLSGGKRLRPYSCGLGVATLSDGALRVRGVTLNGCTSAVPSVGLCCSAGLGATIAP